MWRSAKLTLFVIACHSSFNLNIRHSDSSTHHYHQHTKSTIGSSRPSIISIDLQLIPAGGSDHGTLKESVSL